MSNNLSQNFESFLQSNIIIRFCKHLHMWVLIQSYNKLTITTFIVIAELAIDLNSSFIYGFIIVITIVLFMGHVLSCRVVSYFQFILNLGMPFPWFFVLFIIYNIDVIFSKCYPGWLPSKASWPTTGYSSLIWKGPPNFISMRLNR